jgi:hypothetical protein
MQSQALTLERVAAGGRVHGKGATQCGYRTVIALIVYPQDEMIEVALVAATNARFRSAPAGNSRASITVRCIFRSTYQRGSLVGSRGSKVDRRAMSGR